MFVVEEQKNIKNRIDIRSVVAITQRLGFKLRTDGVSIWLEDSNNNYLMPCEFKEAEALKINNKYLIKVDALDPDEFITTKHIGKRFNFGHPGKIIGSGILISIDN